MILAVCQNFDVNRCARRTEQSSHPAYHSENFVAGAEFRNFRAYFLYYTRHVARHQPVTRGLSNGAARALVAQPTAFFTSTGNSLL